MRMTVTAVLVFAAGMAFGAPAVSGGLVLDVDSGRRPPASPVPDAGGDRELLQNPGFESGVLTPWTTNNWIVDTIHPHTGTYCASDVGNYWIRQEVDTTGCADIAEVSFWSRQPETAIQAVYLYFDDGSQDYDIVYPGAEWTFHDVSYLLNPAKKLVAITIWGYSGGGTDPDSTYIDDVTIRAEDEDVGIVSAPWPPDTVEFDSTYIPCVTVHNYGPVPATFPVAAVIENICDEPYYWDTVDVTLDPGSDTLVEFAAFTPAYLALHRVSYRTLLASDINPDNDTLAPFFYVAPAVAVGEHPGTGGYREVAVWPVPAGYELFLRSSGPAALFDADGRKVFGLRPGSNDIRSVPAGVYFVRSARGGVARLVVQR